MPSIDGGSAHVQTASALSGIAQQRVRLHRHCHYTRLPLVAPCAVNFAVSYNKRQQSLSVSLFFFAAFFLNIRSYMRQATSVTR